MRASRRALFGALVGLFSLGLGRARADGTPGPVSPGWSGPTWRTMQTPHFRIHAYDEEIVLALQLAEAAEKAYGKVTAALRWTPGGRIDITLSDNTDRANGYASVLPRNFIFAYATPPDSVSTLNDYDDWLQTLVTHELTHVVHMDVILGLNRPLNFLSGKLYAPNHIAPTWFTEGLAILEESTFTTGGRARNALVDMFLRMESLDGGLWDVDRVSHAALYYPFGTVPYLYGASFLLYLSERFGPDKLAEIVHRYGSHLMPFGLQRTARQTLGAGYDQLWDDWRAALGRQYQLQLQDVRRQPVTIAHALTNHGEGSAGSLAPRFLPDGQTVLYQRSRSDSRPAFVALDVATGKSRIVAQLLGAGQASPLPDAKSAVLAQVNLQRLPRRISGESHADWDDLFRLNLETGRVTPLTQGQRAGGPDVSPDGTRIAFTRGRPGAVDLAILPVDGGRPTVLGPTGPHDVVYTPAWSPDGKRIAYSRWKSGGYRDIHVYDLDTGIDQALWADRAIDADPRFSPDGRFILFSSDRSGIYNVYAYELSTRLLHQVTNVVGGAFSPVVSPDARTLIFVGFGKAGFDLYAMAYQPSTWRLAPPVLSPREDAAPASDAALATLTTTVLKSSVVESLRDYQPWKYLYPRSWQIDAASDPLGLGPAIGLALGGSDPVGNHELSFSTNVPTSSGDASARFDYVYTGLYPLLGLTAARQAARAGGLIIDGHNQTFTQHAYTAGANLSLPLWRTVESRSSLTLSYSHQRFGSADSLPAPNPAQSVPHPARAGADAIVTLGWTFNNVHSWTRSLGGQEGRALDLNLSHSAETRGGDARTTEINWGWNEYLSVPWARLHALALAYHGGLSTGAAPGNYWLGGFAQQDLAQAFYGNRPQCCFFLRGYAPESLAGNQFHILTAEYRAPVLTIERGFQTVPVYVQRLSGAIFSDAGNAFSGSPRASLLRVGVGGELRLTFKIAYQIENSLFFGLARGLSQGGITDYYVASAFPF